MAGSVRYHLEYNETPGIPPVLGGMSRVFFDKHAMQFFERMDMLKERGCGIASAGYTEITAFK